MDDSTNHRKGSPTAIAFAVVFFLLMFYILSPGPVIWLQKQIHGGPSEPTEYFLKIVYAPLIWLYEKVPVVRSAYDWYFGLFGVQ